MHTSEPGAKRDRLGKSKGRLWGGLGYGESP